MANRVGLLGDARRTPSEGGGDSGGSGGAPYVTQELLNQGIDSNGNPLVPGMFYGYNGQSFQYNAGDPANGQPPFIGNSSTPVITAGGGNTTGGSTTPTPTTPQSQPFDLPWYPLTWGLGPGMYQNLREQIWQSQLPRDPNAQTFGRFDFPTAFPQGSQPELPGDRGGREPGPPRNSTPMGPLPPTQAPGRIPGGPSGGRQNMPAGLLGAPPEAMQKSMSKGLLATPQQADAGLLGMSQPKVLSAPQQGTGAYLQSDTSYGHIPQFGDWTQTTFANPTESWMQNWNALPEQLRPAFAAARIAQDGGGYGTNTGSGFIWQALEGAGLSPQQVEAARTQAIQGLKGNTFRIQDGQLMQLANPTAANPAGSWASLATLANPTGYMPTSVGASPYLAALYGAKSAGGVNSPY